MTHRCSDCGSDNCSCGESARDRIHRMNRSVLDKLSVAEIEKYLEDRKRAESAASALEREAKLNELHRHESEVARLKKELGQS